MSRYKTEWCHFILRSHSCRHGQNCVYAHDWYDYRGPGAWSDDVQRQRNWTEYCDGGRTGDGVVTVVALKVIDPLVMCGVMTSTHTNGASTV